MSGLRVSTANMLAMGTSRISEAQAGLVKTQQQISANRRILSPSDDPVAAARALDVTQSQAMNSAFASNRTMAKNALAEQESVLQGVTSLLEGIKSQVVQAGNPSLDNSQRNFIGIDLRAQYDQLLGMVNSRDATGNYLFAGFQSQTQPFTQSATTGLVQYGGDQGQKSMQVGPARQIQIGDTGDAVFMRVPNQGYGTAAVPGNAGDVAISAFRITNSASLTGHDYEIVLSGVGSPGGPVYSAYDMRKDPGHVAAPVFSGPYVSGALITVDGLSMTLTGAAPANGDTFVLRPKPTQDMFATLDGLILAMQTPAGDEAGKARLGRALDLANSNLGNGLDNVLGVRSAVGSRLREIDELDLAGSDRDIQYQQQLAQLQDLDLLKAISDLTMQQTTLEAAQKSYVKLAGMSLFDFL